jgi:hypothetical protein
MKWKIIQPCLKPVTRNDFPTETSIYEAVPAMTQEACWATSGRDLPVSVAWVIQNPDRSSQKNHDIRDLFIS